MVVIKCASLETTGEENLGCLAFGVNHFTALVITAGAAHLVGQLLFVAVRTLRERQPMQMIVRAPVARAPLRMTSFRIRHYNSSWQAATKGGQNGKG
jgi:hypothetical protein